MATGADDEQLEEALSQLRGFGAIDLSQRLARGELPVGHGRERELERVFAALAERRSVLVLGPTGVGKTALIYEAAARMARGRAPTPLHGARVVQLSTTAVEAGAMNAGVWAGRLQALVDAVSMANDRILVYFDNIWHLPEAGRYVGQRESFATFLRSHLNTRSIVLLGESTLENFTHAGGQDYRRGFALADDPVMSSFVTVEVEEPDLSGTREILQIVALELEEAHAVRIEPVVVERVIELARRFQPYEAFPGKAIRLLELIVRAARADASPSSDGPVTITQTMVTERFAQQTGLPARLFSDTVPITSGEVETYLAERVVGQDEAVQTLVDLVTLIKAELTDPRRPLGVLLFVGPTGSGKTFLARTMAEYLFGSDAKLIRFDMSEYQHTNSTFHLLRQVTDRVRQQRFSVVLLDEIEKASPDIFDLFLQAFDNARLTDPQGQMVDLKNVVFVMTSNLGGGALAPRGLGFAAEATETDSIREDGARRLRAVYEAFRPEFVNRLDKIVTFRALGRDAMRRIARRELGRALEREGVRRRSILLDFGDDVLDLLLDAGFSEEFGARPLQRAIKQEVLVPLARRIASNPSATDQLLQLRVRAGQLVIDTIPLQSPTSSPVDPGLARPEEPAQPPTPEPRYAELTRQLASLHARVTEALASPKFIIVEARSGVLLRELRRPSFWDDPERARLVNGAIYQLARVTQRLVDARQHVDALTEVPSILERHHRTAERAELDRFARRLRRLDDEFQLAMLELLAVAATHEDDLAGLTARVCSLTIAPISAPGAREAGDWPSAVARMYAAWAGRRDYEVSETTEDASLVVTIRGPNVGDMLRGEAGIHKCQSDAGNRRRLVRLARVTLGNDPPPGIEDLVRVYHLSGASSVRDPRTGHRSPQPRDVLGGAIDGFLLAWLGARR